MCGILGSNGNYFSIKDIQDGLKTIKYRGPDKTSITKLNDDTFFGMNRLTIRDLKPNLYPFVYQQYQLILNGEIYNLDELKKLVPQFKTKTTCDAEIILPLFNKFGFKAFDLLVGMFAIAIYDSKSQKIYLARDKFGEKPLYYYFNNGSFFFASEISAFPKKIKTIEKSSIPKFLTFGFIPDQNTFFSHIHKLKPGQFLEFNIPQKKIKINFYNSKISELSDKLSLSQVINKLDFDLNTIIKNKLVADFPVGIFLSGGVDSSLITALAQKNSITPIHTFSVGFKEKNVDESKYALEVSKFLKTNHTHIILSGKDIKKHWQKIITSLDEPISDPAIFPTYLLAESASKFVKVILSGEGADEIFGGYHQYQIENFISKFSFLKLSLFQKISLVFSNPKYWKIFSPFSSHYTQTIYNILWSDGLKNKKLFQKLIEKSWQNYFNDFKITSKKNLQNIQYYDLNNYLAEQLCMKVDKMTMKFSIESRAFFLDGRLLPYLNLSSKLIKKNLPNKYLLRSVAQKYLPKGIVWRKKHGFALPLNKWIKNDLKSELFSLKRPHPYIVETISQQTINNLIQDFIENGQNELSIWNLITLNSWLKLNRY